MLLLAIGDATKVMQMTQNRRNAESKQTTAAACKNGHPGVVEDCNCPDSSTQGDLEEGESYGCCTNVWSAADSVTMEGKCVSPSVCETLKSRSEPGVTQFNADDRAKSDQCPTEKKDSPATTTAVADLRGSLAVAVVAWICMGML